MVSKRFYIKILLRILLLAISFLLFFALLSYYPNISMLVITGMLITLQIILLLQYINTVNRRLESFFIHHLSGEVTAGFGAGEKANELDGLYRYFSLINEKLEKARAESEIRNNYFKTIVDHTSVGLISFTADGQVELFNDAAKRIFDLHVLKDLKKLDTIREGLSDILISMSPQDLQVISLVIRNELVQLTLRKGTFKTGEKMLYLVSFQNIVHELEQQEIESWQKLVRVLTHEIMNSITPISSLVTTLGRLFIRKDQDHTISPSEVTEQIIERTVRGLEVIENRGQGLIHFVQNYRDVTLIPKPVFQVVVIRNLFNHLQVFYEETLNEKGIVFKSQCNQLLQLRADGRLLQQVMINLVKNAIEALDGRQNPQISLSAQSMQEKIVIEISDNGWGMTQEVLEQIFIPFFTTKPSGSGIGLSLSRQIVRMHGGSMSVYSVPDMGTTFTIRI